MSKRHGEDIAGFKVLEVLKANFQRDFFVEGQGFPIEVHRVPESADGVPAHYVAQTRDGLHKVTASTEEEASRLLRSGLQDKAIRGEL